jgi:hypothetical protein
MTAAALRRDPGNVFVVIGDTARATSIQVLVALESAGLAGALAIYFWAPARWPFMLPCLALTALGLWGVCERLIASRAGHRHKRQRKLLRGVARAIAATGIAAMLLSFYLLMGWVMGVYIS